MEMKSYFSHMKFLPKLILFLFVFFLLTPTIVTLIEKKTDISIFYSFSDEEETVKDIKEVKADLKYFIEDSFFVSTTNKNSKIISKNASFFDQVFSNIFSPPPKLI